MHLSKIIDEEMRNPKPCDGCTVCCVILKIEDPALEKPAMEPCKHLCGAGCGIYESRPEVCSGFECLYRMGFLVGPTSYRPDQLGLMFWMTGDASDPDAPPQCLVAYEARPGAANEPKAKYLIDAIKEQTALFIVTYEGGRRLVGPKRVVQAIMHEANERAARRAAREEAEGNTITMTGEFPL